MEHISSVIGRVMAPAAPSQGMDRAKAARVIERAKVELGVPFTVAGSYRRGKEEGLHDVDLLVVDEQRAGCRDRIEILGEPVDVVFAAAGDHGPALLYLTGSRSLNIRQRTRAKRMGFKLNRFGLWCATSGERLDDNTERGIFALLDMNYMEPAQR